jgi:hypothetical protein
VITTRKGARSAGYGQQDRGCCPNRWPAAPDWHSPDSAGVGSLTERYPGLAMATRKINLMLDEELVRRTRRQDTGEASKSDVQVVEDALAVFLGLRALEDARAQGTLEADEADRLAVQEVRAVRRARRQAA